MIDLRLQRLNINVSSKEPHWKSVLQSGNSCGKMWEVLLKFETLVNKDVSNPWKKRGETLHVGPELVNFFHLNICQESSESNVRLAALHLEENVYNL